jgi:hypothetical protein
VTSGAGAARPVHHLENVMGTVVTIDVYTGRDLTDGQVAEIRRQLGRARAILRHADEIFSTWQPRTPVSRLG